MNRVLFSIGPITIYWYSVTMLIAILVGVLLTINESRRDDTKKYIDDLIFSTILFGIIGARLYYVIFNFDMYKNDILSIFKIWEGGIAIYGAIIGGFISILYNAKKYKQGVLATTDKIVPGLLLAQAIGRWGNFFNQEAHGVAISRQFLEKLYLPNFIINGMYIEGTYYHPTFLYESLWCLLGFIIIMIICNKINLKKGTRTYLYFIWYGIGRFFIEGLRTDSLYIGTIRISQLVSIILIISGIIGIGYNYLRVEKREKL